MTQPLVNERIQLLAARRSGITILYVMAIILSLSSLLLLLQTVKVATAGYDLQRLKQVQEEWRQRNHQLRAEVSQLQSLARVEKEAKARFKMVPATQYVYVTVALAPEASTSVLESSPHTSDQREIGATNLLERWQQVLQSWKSGIGLFREEAIPPSMP